MKKKILVMYARYGSGHKTIAEYVAKYMEEHNDNADVMALDMTDYANGIGRFTVKIMDFVSKYRPEKIFDTCYELMDHKISSIGHNQLARKSYDNKKLRKVISDFNPDVTISSHFYCSSIITYYNSLHIINTKLLTIITDYRTHEWWTRNHKKEDGFIVGNEMVKQELISRGVESKKVHAFGLPLNIKQISKLDDEEEILKRYNLSGSRKIYLFFGGSSAGSMYYFDYFKMLLKLDINADIVFVSGKNEKLKYKCDEYVREKNIKNVRVLGFTNDVFNLMKISDLVISKPGGATVTECLEMHRPMLLVPGIGGQEKYNAKFISKKKYGIRVRSLWSFKMWIKKLEETPEMIMKMKKRMDKQSQNKSVEKINDLFMKL